MTDPPSIGVEVRLFNWPLRKARTARGWTRRDLALASGLSQGQVGDAEALEPVSAYVREKIALALGAPEDDLFPGATEPAANPIDVPLVAGCVDDVHRDDPAIDPGLLRADLAAALGGLYERQRQVLALRYGLDGDAPMTLDEVGAALGGIGRERVRQIEAEALRMLRRGAGRQLRPWIGEEPPAPPPKPRPVPPPPLPTPPLPVDQVRLRPARPKPAPRPPALPKLPKLPPLPPLEGPRNRPPAPRYTTGPPPGACLISPDGCFRRIPREVKDPDAEWQWVIKALEGDQPGHGTWCPPCWERLRRDYRYWRQSGVTW